MQLTTALVAAKEECRALELKAALLSQVGLSPVYSAPPAWKFPPPAWKRPRLVRPFVRDHPSAPVRMRSFSVPQDKVHNDREMEQLRNARDVAMASAKQTSSSLSEKLEAFGELRIEKEKVRALFFLWRFRFGCICSRAGGR